MGYWLRKNRLIAVTIISLALNVVAAFIIYQDSKITIDSHEKNLIKAEPLDYETFKNRWGNAWLGLEVADVTLEVALRKSLDRAEGAYVKTVAAGSPAQKADIAPTDVILSFNGRKIRTPEQLQSDLSGSEVSGEVYMCVAKDDYRLTVYAVPEERPAYLTPVTKTFPRLGIEVAEVTFGSDEAEKLQEAAKAGGVLVEMVLADSPAEKAGLQKDDVIMSFNSRKTRTLREFLSDLAGCQPGDNVRMCIMRDDYRKTIYVTLEDDSIFLEI
ncbi:MAG TPA: PDZ domain-containing protein [Planctomycetes bacterium]|nr:PDZ domain-containing protein [Planctomycetota bacterium]